MRLARLDSRLGFSWSVLSGLVLGGLFFPVLFLPALLLPTPAFAGGKGVFYDEESSRRELFPGAASVAADTLKLDSATAAAAKSLVRQPIAEKEVVFERILSRRGPIGYIYRARERGKVELMDFAVALDTAGKVQRVLLTAYRENIGGEVGSKRFMDQFKGKSSGSALQLNRDIDGISGASLSSRAITVGVRKAVGFWKLKYAKA
ncbi:MAG TPA: FMN-binding protein [Fibrobacteria bacterium]|nr:FMN-binding protein [Fibrobacteria bacterium]